MAPSLIKAFNSECIVEVPESNKSTFPLRTQKKCMAAPQQPSPPDPRDMAVNPPDVAP